jgi:5-amino-6-(5-phosphoribosylamino)uracil reductase
MHPGLRYGPVRPYTIVSCAVSLDGYLDDASPERLILSNAADWDEVDALRAEVDAIMVGAGTIRADNPRLLIRSPQRASSRLATGRAQNPLRVTLTSTGDLDPRARFFTGPGDHVVYRDATPANVLHRLASERSVRSLLIEGGATLVTQVLAAGLADELRLAIAPFLIGDGTAPRFALPARYPQGPGHPMTLLSARQLDQVAVLHYRLTDRERP